MLRLRQQSMQKAQFFFVGRMTTFLFFRSQYKLDFSGLAGRSTTGQRDDDGGSGVAGDSKGSSTSTEASM